MLIQLPTELLSHILDILIHTDPFSYILLARVHRRILKLIQNETYVFTRTGGHTPTVKPYLDSVHHPSFKLDRVFLGRGEVDAPVPKLIVYRNSPGPADLEYWFSECYERVVRRRGGDCLVIRVFSVPVYMTREALMMQLKGLGIVHVTVFTREEDEYNFTRLLQGQEVLLDHEFRFRRDPGLSLTVGSVEPVVICRTLQ